jgi:hypothetical protein
MVQPDGLRAVKGVHSLGWEGREEESWRNWDSCRRMWSGLCINFGLMNCLCHLCFGPECLCVILGIESLYVD